MAETRGARRTASVGGRKTVGKKAGASGNAALREESFFRFALDKANDIIVVIQDGKYAYVNDKFLTLFGGTREDFLGKPFGGYIHEDDRPAVFDYHRRRQEGKSVPPVYEARLRKADRNYMLGEISAMNIEYEGRNASLAYIRDVTERKQVETALRENSQRYINLLQSVTDIIIV